MQYWNLTFHYYRTTSIKYGQVQLSIYKNLEDVKSPEQWQKVESKLRWLYGGGWVFLNRIW